MRKITLALLSAMMLSAVYADCCAKKECCECRPITYFALCDWQKADVYGLRLGIPYSTVQSKVCGLDVGFWGECDDARVFAAEVLYNRVGNTFAGIQIGCYNTIKQGLNFSWQIGLVNDACCIQGFQTGLVNMAKFMQGLQIGLLNVADDAYGIQIGLVNYIKASSVTCMPVINMTF